MKDKSTQLTQDRYFYDDFEDIFVHESIDARGYSTFKAHLPGMSEYTPGKNSKLALDVTLRGKKISAKEYENG